MPAHAATGCPASAMRSSAPAGLPVPTSRKPFRRADPVRSAAVPARESRTGTCEPADSRAHARNVPAQGTGGAGAGRHVQPVGQVAGQHRVAPLSPQAQRAERQATLQLQLDRDRDRVPLPAVVRPVRTAVRAARPSAGPARPVSGQAGSRGAGGCRWPPRARLPLRVPGGRSRPHPCEGTVRAGDIVDAESVEDDSHR